MILGLDISSSVIGYSVIDWNGCMAVCKHLEFDKDMDIYGKLVEFQKLINDIQSDYNISHVAIEEPVSKYAAGKSSADTIAKLNRFNGCCTWIVYQQIGLKPMLISSGDARKSLGIKRVKDETGKQAVMNWMLANHSEWFVPALNKNTNVYSWNYDRADSFVIAQAALKKFQ